MNSCIVGLQWGDEGKGKVVDILAEQHDIVVRYSGGANAGHTVVVGDDRFALHLLPSGSVRPDTICVITNAVVVDPDTLLKEIEALAQRNITLMGRRRRTGRIIRFRPRNFSLCNQLKLKFTWYASRLRHTSQDG